MSTPKSKAQASPCILWTDDICVYLNIKVRNPLYAKIALLCADLFIFSIVALGIVIDIPGLSIVSLFFLAILTWYSLWNFAGEELLIINAVSLSYQHHYGFIKTSFTTKKFHKRLLINAVDIKPDGSQQMMQISFTSYSSDNIPFELYRTSFYISNTDRDRLMDLINTIMLNEITDKYQFPEISPN